MLCQDPKVKSHICAASFTSLHGHSAGGHFVAHLRHRFGSISSRLLILLLPVTSLPTLPTLVLRVSWSAFARYHSVCLKTILAWCHHLADAVPRLKAQFGLRTSSRHSSLDNPYPTPPLFCLSFSPHLSHHLPTSLLCSLL